MAAEHGLQHVGGAALAVVDEVLVLLDGLEGFFLAVPVADLIAQAGPHTHGLRALGQALVIDSIKQGVTTIFDHHASFCEIPGSLMEIAKVTESMGMRACLCYESGNPARWAILALFLKSMSVTSHQPTPGRQALCRWMARATFMLSSMSLDDDDQR